MRVINNKIEFTTEDEKMIFQINEFAHKFYMNNHLCTNLRCTKCPFRLFCTDDIEEIYERFEKFVNNEE